MVNESVTSMIDFSTRRNSYRFWFTFVGLPYALISLLFWLTRSLLRFLITRTSSPHRKFLLHSVRKNKEEFGAQRQESPKTEDGDWEHVRGSSEKQKTSQILQDASFDGFIGFFHPFANAGGGGERVLWAAIKATQERYPNAICVVYTGDHQSNKSDILDRVKQRFDIPLYAPTLLFLYLQKRSWVVASSYPRFTLLLQSLGSIFVAHEALARLTPDIFIDTMGYSFSTWYTHLLFPSIPIGSYVHYPFIGTHMVDSLSSTTNSQSGIHAGRGAGIRGLGKKLYWHALLHLYKRTGTSITTIMTNSTWTQAHIHRIWGPRRQSSHLSPPTVVYPPCPVQSIISQTSLTQSREPLILSIAQFRPEKNHELLLSAFASFLSSIKSSSAPSPSSSSTTPHLTLIGSVRDPHDETLVYKLRLQAAELHITSHVTFLINASYSSIIDHLRRASVGVNTMWCEHFGIGVVEYQAAGLLCVVNDSGGPKEDIVVGEVSGKKQTGWHASTVEDYAAAFKEALAITGAEEAETRAAARESSLRFSEEVFEERWGQVMTGLIAAAPKKEKAS